MNDITTQAQRNISRTHNEEVVTDQGYKRNGNSSLFGKKGSYLFSPGISTGKHQKYWFDIREKNLQKIEKGSNVNILLRIYPNAFAYISLEYLQPYLIPSLADTRLNSGIVWGFYCEIKADSKQIEIIPKNKTSVSIVADLLTKQEATSALKM